MRAAMSSSLTRFDMSRRRLNSKRLSSVAFFLTLIARITRLRGHSQDSWNFLTQIVMNTLPPFSSRYDARWERQNAKGWTESGCTKDSSCSDTHSRPHSSHCSNTSILAVSMGHVVNIVECNRPRTVILQCREVEQNVAIAIVNLSMNSQRAEIRKFQRIRDENSSIRRDEQVKSEFRRAHVLTKEFHSHDEGIQVLRQAEEIDG